MDGAALMTTLKALCNIRSSEDYTHLRLGIRDEFIEHATQAKLRSQYGLDEAGIILAVKEMLKK